MSARQQQKKACFARRASNSRFARRMHRLHGDTPGFLGAVLNNSISTKDGRRFWGRGYMIITNSAQHASKPLIPSRVLVYDEATDGPLESLAQKRTNTFEAGRVVYMGTCGLPKTTAIVGKFTTNDFNVEALRDMFSAPPLFDYTAWKAKYDAADDIGKALLKIQLNAEY